MSKTAESRSLVVITADGIKPATAAADGQIVVDVAAADLQRHSTPTRRRPPSAAALEKSVPRDRTGHEVCLHSIRADFGSNLVGDLNGLEYIFPDRAQKRAASEARSRSPARATKPREVGDVPLFVAHAARNMIEASGQIEREEREAQERVKRERESAARAKRF